MKSFDNLETQIYLVRHAHSIYSADELNRPLSSSGEEAALQAADLLKDEQITTIISSPYKRAVQTVEPLAVRNGLAIHIEEGFRERLLSDEHLEDFNYAITKVWEEESFSWPGGESNLAAQQRGVQALEKILQEHQGRKIAIGTHGNIMVLIMNALNSKYGFEFWKQLNMPDIYKLSFNGFALHHVERIWKSSE